MPRAAQNGERSALSNRGGAKNKSRTSELVQTAARLFYERGYDATSIQDVADELGILKGSVYYYIKSKDDLLFAVIDDHHQMALAHVEACRKSTGDPVERLCMFMRGYATLLDRHRITVAVFLNDFERLSKDRRRQIVKEREQYSDFVAETLREGLETGQFRADLDPTRAALAILGMLNWSFRWYKPKGGYTSAEVVEEFLQLSLRGCLAEVTDLPPVVRATPA